MRQKVISLLLTACFSSPSIAALECAHNETGPGSVIDFSFGPTPKLSIYSLIVAIQGVNGIITTNDDIIKVEYHHNQYRGDVISADYWNDCITSGLWQYTCGYNTPLALPDTVDEIKIYLAPGIPATEYTLRLSFTKGEVENSLSYEGVVDATNPVSVTTATWVLGSTYTLDPGKWDSDGLFRKSENPSLIPGPEGATGTIAGTNIHDDAYVQFTVGGVTEYLGNGIDWTIPEGEAIGITMRSSLNESTDQAFSATLNCP